MSRAKISEINAAVLDVLGLDNIGHVLSAVTVTLHRTSWPTARLEVVLDQATGRTERQFVRLVPEGYEDPQQANWLDKACAEAMKRVQAWIDQATEEAKQATREEFGWEISLGAQMRDVVLPGEFFTLDVALGRLGLALSIQNELRLRTALIRHGYAPHREATGERRRGFIAPGYQEISSASLQECRREPHPAPNKPASQRHAYLRPASSPETHWPKSPQQAAQPEQKSHGQFAGSSLPPDFGGASLLGQLGEVAAVDQGVRQ